MAATPIENDDLELLRQGNYWFPYVAITVGQDWGLTMAGIVIAQIMTEGQDFPRADGAYSGS